MENVSRSCVFDHIMNGIILNISGKYDKAINEFTHAINITPKHKVAHYQRAIAYDAMGNKKAVMEDLRSSARFGYVRAQKVLRLQNISY